MPLTPSLALAALQEAAGGAPALDGGAGPDLTRYLLVSSGLLIGIAGLAFALRRFVGRRLVAKAARRSLQVIDALPLGGRQRLLVVRCYDRTFLLGQGEKELGLVAELDAVIAPAAQPLASAADQRAFARWLERASLTPASARRPPKAVRPAPRERTSAAPPRGGSEWVG
jgi:flagellar biogenesis protein FliO